MMPLESCTSSRRCMETHRRPSLYGKFQAVDFLYYFETLLAMTTQRFYAKPPRDLDELEGTLLHTATPVPTEAVSAQVAVPFSSFHYPSNVECISVNATVQESDSTLPTAPLLPMYTDLKSREKEEMEKRMLGTKVGLAKADAEQTAMARASRDIFSIQYHAKNAVAQANEIAHSVNNSRGTEIQKDNWLGKETSIEAPKQEEFSFSTAPGGYEVAAYDVSAYTPRDEYVVTEYKSIYESNS